MTSVQKTWVNGVRDGNLARNPSDPAHDTIPGASRINDQKLMGRQRVDPPAPAPAYPRIDNHVAFHINQQAHMDNGNTPHTPDGDESIQTMDALVEKYRVRHEDQADVIIRNGGAPRRLSLTTFSIPRFAGNPALVLDLEAYIECHLKALTATRSVMDLMAGSGLDTRLATTARRLQAFFHSLHRNLRQLTPPPQRVSLPDIDGRLSFDTLLMIEAWIASRIWRNRDDLQRFEEIFRRAVADPVQAVLVDPRQRYRYHLSILSAALDQ